MWFNLTSHVPTSPKIRASALSRKASRWLSDPMAFRTNLATWKLIPKPLDLQPQDWIKTNSWLNQPIWKMFVKMGENLSQCSGWKLTKNIWVATTYKNDPLKRLLLFFFAFFSAVFMKKKLPTCRCFPQTFSSQNSPKNLASVASPSATWGTWQGVRTISTGGKTMRLHKYPELQKKIMKIHQGVQKRDHYIIGLLFQSLNNWGRKCHPLYKYPTQPGRCPFFMRLMRVFSGSPTWIWVNFLPWKFHFEIVVTPSGKFRKLSLGFDFWVVWITIENVVTFWMDEIMWHIYKMAVCVFTTSKRQQITIPNDVSIENHPRIKFTLQKLAMKNIHLKKKNKSFWSSVL